MRDKKAQLVDKAHGYTPAQVKKIQEYWKKPEDGFEFETYDREKVMK